MNRSQSAKRKLPFGGLQRRVRPRKEEPDLDEIDSDSAASHNSDEEDEDSDDASEAEDDDENGESGSSDEDDDEAEQDDLDPSQISFGALARAQASLPPARRKHGKGGEESDEDNSGSDAPSEEDNAGRPKFGGQYEKREKLAKRSSKHAPTEVTARRAVTRKREVVPVQKVQARDPRFGPLGGGAGTTNVALQEKAHRENYAFLEQYRDDEMAALRAEIKKTKNPAAKEKLQRSLMSMQGRRQAQQRRDAERAVVDEHRRREKEAVKQGKTPFYLKKSEQKKQLLVDRFASMKKKDVDKTIEKKRKKLASKERRELPMERRQR